jgi:hypothetical protein
MTAHYSFVNLADCLDMGTITFFNSKNYIRYHYQMKHCYSLVLNKVCERHQFDQSMPFPVVQQSLRRTTIRPNCYGSLYYGSHMPREIIC